MDFKLAFDEATARGDLAIEAGDLALDPGGVSSATIASLFSDARARADDRLPDAAADRRGFWGDALEEEITDRLGSRLWLIEREKQLQETVNRAVEFAREGLLWLTRDGIAQSVEVRGEITAPGVLGLDIAIVRPDRSRLNFRFDHLWEGL